MVSHADTGRKSSSRATIDHVALTLLLARIGLAADFMLFGAHKFNNPQEIWSFIAARGLPGWLVYPAMTLQLVGGLGILLGFQTRFFAAFFAWFCIVAPSLFWTDNLENLTRDYATAGGFLLLMLFGPGKISLDALFRNMRDIVAAFIPFVVRSRGFIDGVCLVARALIALPYLADVVKKIVHMAEQRALFESKGIAGDAIYLVMLIELVFGLMVLFGYRTRQAALVLIAWSVILAGAIHFPNSLGVFKDITTIASLLILIVYGPGAISRDAGARRAEPAEPDNILPEEKWGRSNNGC